MPVLQFSVHLPRTILICSCAPPPCWEPPNASGTKVIVLPRQGSHTHQRVGCPWISQQLLSKASFSWSCRPHLFTQDAQLAHLQLANNTCQLARTFCFPIAIAQLTCLPGRLLSHWNALRFAVWWSNSLVDTVSCSCILLQTELLDDIESHTASPQRSKTGLQLFVKILLIKNAARTTIFLIIKW